MNAHSSSVAADEIAQFSRQAEDWWNEDGQFKPLHRLNPVRLGYLRDRMCAHTGCDPEVRTPLQGLKILDIGCGGGLITEPLTRLGGEVTGLDASAPTIAIARKHAKAQGLDIDYRASNVEALAQKSLRYDVITALEIIEHVADVDVFLGAVAKLLKPGGLLIMSTLNRTPKSFLLGIVAAEHVLRWVPRGTHQWRKFIRPSELVLRLEALGLVTHDLTGMIFNPLRNTFELRREDVDVNYLLSAVKV